MSGSAGIRGYLVQTVIALVDAFHPENDWRELILEPSELGDKVDILWLYPDRAKAVQVKSSQNEIRKSQVEEWARDLIGNTEGVLRRLSRPFPRMEYELQLVGPCRFPEFTDLEAELGVRIPRPKNLDLDGLASEAAYKLGRHLENTVQSVSFLEVGRMVNELIWELARRSTFGRPMTRAELHSFFIERAKAELTEEASMVALPGEPPVNPSLFLGRAEDLEKLKSQLGANPMRVLTAQPQTKKHLAVRGWPGIGKTAVATVLGNDPDIRGAFADGVLWTSLGENPNLIGEMAVWGRKLGTDEVLRAPTLKEATVILAACLRNKRVLLIVDDLWDASHAVPYQQARGKDCALLVTTRQPGIAEQLSSPDGIYNLPILTPETSLELLRILAPAVVAENRTECLELVNDLECLPLALHVAGRLLNEESKMGWGVKELLDDLRKGAKIIEAKAPADRLDYEMQTIPTVASLLAKSTNCLDSFTRDCFAFLGPFAPKPATFDAEAMKSVWMVDDPKPIVRKLVGLGLLEPVGGRFQMHALLVAHAKSFLTEE